MGQTRDPEQDLEEGGADGATGAAGASATPKGGQSSPVEETPVVSITKVRNDNVAAAVEEAIDLLGGIAAVTQGRERIMLKPNLVISSPDCTTKPQVIETLARLMQNAGKQVLIGEGSAAAAGFNVEGDEFYRTKNRGVLDAMQQHVFDELGYTELARSMDIPLINLHSGEMVDVPVPGGYVFEKITLHRSLTEIDLLCSVPMMKTHVLARVTLGMKNLVGLYPGTVYYSVRAWLHDHAAEAGSPGTAYETIDMVRANKLGLVIVDGSTAMEGDGPAGGDLVEMGVIVAGTNPLATDVVAACLMGYQPEEIPTFTCAHETGMGPVCLKEIEIRGNRVDQVRREFKRPNVVAWNDIRASFGAKEIP